MKIVVDQGRISLAVMELGPEALEDIFRGNYGKGNYRAYIERGEPTPGFCTVSQEESKETLKFKVFQIVPDNTRIQ